jgi:hypothetical protein
VLDLREEIFEDRCLRQKNEQGEFSNIEKPDVSEPKGNDETKKKTEAEAKA